jgi:hypothetical protein
MDDLFPQATMLFNKRRELRRGDSEQNKQGEASLPEGRAQLLEFESILQKHSVTIHHLSNPR